MPLLDDQDLRAPGFDLTTASTLFWRPVSVSLKQQDRDDQEEQLTFRILTGFARQNHTLRVRTAPSAWLRGQAHQARRGGGPAADDQPRPRRRRPPHTRAVLPCPQVLRIHISSESDLYFLHTLEVSEEDFQSLKNDQGILVDFASFPGKLISLLERCTAAQQTDSPR
jgi:spindle assembly abnormal protein 6